MSGTSISSQSIPVITKGQFKEGRVDISYLFREKSNPASCIVEIARIIYAHLLFCIFLIQPSVDL